MGNKMYCCPSRPSLTGNSASRQRLSGKALQNYNFFYTQQTNSLKNNDNPAASRIFLRLRRGFYCCVQARCRKMVASDTL